MENVNKKNEQNGTFFDSPRVQQMIINSLKEVFMKAIWVALILTITLSNNLFPQTTYYISSSQGNDSNSGTTELAPWQSLAKVDSFSFVPGDRLLFKQGDMWMGQLTIKNSGTPSNRILLSNYGSGEKPIITLRAPIIRTWTQSNSTVWYIETQSQYIPIERIWFNGVEKEQAKDAWGGNNWDGTSGICPEHPFYHDAVGGRLYIYSLGNPTSYYSSIEYQGGLLNNPIQYHTVQLIDADYITIDGLDIQGGGYGALGLAGSDYVEIKNCNIGKFSSRAAFFANSNQINWLATDQTSDFGKVYNCEINSYWNYSLKFYTSLTPYGILIGWGASNWEVYNNYIKDWWFGVYTGTGQTNNEKSFYHKIYQNEITSPNFSYGKGIQITAWNLPATGIYTWCEVFNNYIHNIRAAGMCIASSGNKAYFNIIDNIDVSRCPEKGDQSNSGMGMELIIDQSWGFNIIPDSNYIFNNTFYRLNRTAMNWSNPFVMNNLFLQTGMSTTNALAVNQNAFRYYNNLFYKTGSDINTTFVWKQGTSSYYSIPNFNALGGSISGNIYPVGKTLSQIMNTNHTIPTGSPAIDAGISISALTFEGFTDRLGNIVDRQNPDLGAIQSSSNPDVTPPRLLSAALSDSARLVLYFSELMNSTGISTLSNYSISDGIIVLSAQLNSSNQTQVILTTSAHLFGQNYNISVNNLRDLAGNYIQSTNNSAAYTSNFNPPSSGPIKLTIFNAIASDTNDINYGPEKTVDGLYFSNGGAPFSRWAAMPTPQWLLYDLGTIKKINKLKLSFYEYQAGRIYTYNAYVSYDQVNWTQVVNNALSTNQEWTEHTFNNIQAKFVKVEIVSNNQNTWATVWEVEIWGSNSANYVSTSAKVFMQGTYSDGQMNSTLNDLSQLPMQQPYNISPWNYNGYESVTTVPLGVVDWVLVELRNDTSAASSVFKRAAFITADGYIVDLDGTSPVVFNGISSSNYYIVLRHRNHLSIMSANKILLSGTSSLYDFTQSKASAYGNDLAALGNNKYGMYAGDGDANGSVNILDYSSVGNNLFQAGYKMGDLDMNGIINILDYGKTNQNLLKFSKVP